MVVAMHLFHGAALGAVFRLLLLVVLGTTILSSTVLVDAIVYSMLLWIVSPHLTRSLFECSGGFQMTRKGLGVSFLSHNAYGIFLGLLTPAMF